MFDNNGGNMDNNNDNDSGLDLLFEPGDVYESPLIAATNESARVLHDLLGQVMGGITEILANPSDDIDPLLALDAEQMVEQVKRELGDGGRDNVVPSYAKMLIGHCRGWWGDCSPGLVELNDQALLFGDAPMISVWFPPDEYHPAAPGFDGGNIRDVLVEKCGSLGRAAVWIITAADRTRTWVVMGTELNELIDHVGADVVGPPDRYVIEGGE